MTIIGNTGPSSGPAPSLGAGIFAHTGLRMGTEGSNQTGGLAGQGSGTTTSAGAGNGSNSSSVGSDSAQHPQPQPQGEQGHNTQSQGTQNKGGNVTSEEARRAAESELKELQRRIAEIQGALAVNPINQLFVENPTPTPTPTPESRPVMPKPSSPPKRQTSKIPELPDMIEGHKASPLSLLTTTQSVVVAKHAPNWARCCHHGG
ncbi:hypothetical protein F5880DRAFT_223994 [Lentinula raphanica]|nr:hypothetical protein F5880DRAFT_223994 [Lentinula raphanica]